MSSAGPAAASASLAAALAIIASYLGFTFGGADGTDVLVSMVTYALLAFSATYAGIVIAGLLRRE